MLAPQSADTPLARQCMHSRPPGLADARLPDDEHLQRRNSVIHFGALGENMAPAPFCSKRSSTIALGNKHTRVGDEISIRRDA